MSFRRSLATKPDLSTYMEGSCHYFATVLHRHTGWPILLVYDKGHPSIRNEQGETLHYLMHVACLDPEGNAWDATGVVHRADAARHYRRYMRFKKIGFDIAEDPGVFDRYIGFGDYQTLADQYPASIEWADRDARRILKHFDIIPAPEEFTDAAPVGGMEAFEEDYATGAASVSLATAISQHFGYPAAAAFGRDGRIVRAWSEDLDGRPITSSGLLRDHAELELPADCFVKIWDIPHHMMCDGRLRRHLGSEALNTTSVLEAFSLAASAFTSIKDTCVDGGWLTADSLRANVDEVLVDLKYEEDFGGLKENAATGRRHLILGAGAATDEGSDPHASSSIRG